MRMFCSAVNIGSKLKLWKIVHAAQGMDHIAASAVVLDQVDGLNSDAARCGRVLHTFIMSPPYLAGPYARMMIPTYEEITARPIVRQTEMGGRPAPALIMRIMSSQVSHYSCLCANSVGHTICKRKPALHDISASFLFLGSSDQAEGTPCGSMIRDAPH